MNEPLRFVRYQDRGGYSVAEVEFVTGGLAEPRWYGDRLTFEARLESLRDRGHPCDVTLAILSGWPA